MDNLTIIIPFWNGHSSIDRLIAGIHDDIPVIVVDDLSDRPYRPDENSRIQVIRPEVKGFFTGAVNVGILNCNTDILILNQDIYFENNSWVELIEKYRKEYSIIGERIGGNHPAWVNGYIHGTFMYIRRDLINKVGLLNSSDYPLWGSTCEYQLRAARAGYKALALREIPGFVHQRGSNSVGESIGEMLKRRPQDRSWFLRTPPEVSVIIPCYNQGRFLKDAVNSLIGGETSLGKFSPQTFQSFEVIIVDDCSTDDSAEIGASLDDPSKGIHFIKREKNGGTSAANNTGIMNAYGRFVTIMCADDMMETDRLETFYRRAQKDPGKVYYDDMQIFTEGQRREIWPMKEYNFKELIQKNFMHAGIFYLREAWRVTGGYPEVMRWGREDWAMAVRLGAHGFCGERIPVNGYLYRRENHNRTLTNTTPTWRAKFLAQIQGLYPGIYKGEFPMGCCGGGHAVTKSNSKTSGLSARIVPMSAGAVVLEYIGTSTGTQTFYGPVTGTRYSAGLTRKMISVDPRDLRTGHLKKKGLLELSENNKTIFKIYTPPPVEKTAQEKAVIASIREEEPIKWAEAPEAYIEQVEDAARDTEKAIEANGTEGSDFKPRIKKTRRPSTKKPTSSTEKNSKKSPRKGRAGKPSNEEMTAYSESDESI